MLILTSKGVGDNTTTIGLMLIPTAIGIVADPEHDKRCFWCESKMIKFDSKAKIYDIWTNLRIYCKILVFDEDKFINHLNHLYGKFKWEKCKMLDMDI